MTTFDASNENKSFWGEQLNPLVAPPGPSPMANETDSVPELKSEKMDVKLIVAEVVSPDVPPMISKSVVSPGKRKK